MYVFRRTLVLQAAKSTSSHLKNANLSTSAAVIGFDPSKINVPVPKITGKAAVRRSPVAPPQRPKHKLFLPPGIRKSTVVPSQGVKKSLQRLSAATKGKVLVPVPKTARSRAVSQTSPAVSQTSPAVSQTSRAVSQTSPAVSQTSPAVSSAKTERHGTDTNGKVVAPAPMNDTKASQTDAAKEEGRYGGIVVACVELSGVSLWSVGIMLDDSLVGRRLVGDRIVIGLAAELIPVGHRASCVVAENPLMHFMNIPPQPLAIHIRKETSSAAQK